MTAPPVYLDECVDHRLATALSERGFTVATARDAALLQMSDEQQLVFATSRDSLIITHNQRDFYQLHRAFQTQNRSLAGIILMSESAPLKRLTLRVAMLLDWIATMPEYRGQIFRWGAFQTLLDNGLLLPPYTGSDLDFVRGRSG